MGHKTTVCKGTCDEWHEQCKDDFFEYHSLSEELVPCSDKSLVCSQLKELATDGADLCRKGGLRVSATSLGSCFDGTVPPVLGICKAKPASGPSAWEELLIKAQFYMVLLMMTVLCGGILLLFFSAHRSVSPDAGHLEEQEQPPANLPPIRAAGMAAIERNKRRQN